MINYFVSNLLRAFRKPQPTIVNVVTLTSTNEDVDVIRRALARQAPVRPGS